EPAMHNAVGSLIEVGTRVVMLTVSSVAVLGLSWTLGLLMRTRDQNRNAELLRVEEQSRRQLAEQETVIEQERNRIARDMHDVVAHSLAVVIAQADGARYAAAANPAAAPAALETIAATARESLAEVRALLTAMRHQEQDGPQPGMADLPPLLAQFRDSGLPVVERTSGTPVTLGRGHEMAAYRIIQEALTNALRHGQPGGPAVLDLFWGAEGLDLVVHNPVGAAEPGGPGGGHGLPGMRERAALAGGFFSAERQGARFRVAARIPSSVPGTATQPISVPPATTPARPAPSQPAAPILSPAPAPPVAPEESATP
ncbi:sensor histidine kinase, partial [Leucobacter sp. M11]|uniref:sensor histidine kinase n=1 Tax=Leucobacter sp. M11 TaxID=2993565 RepID=UPI002D80C2DD